MLGERRRAHDEEDAAQWAERMEELGKEEFKLGFRGAKNLFLSLGFVRCKAMIDNLGEPTPSNLLVPSFLG